MWGCHSRIADELACTTDNTGEISNKIARPLFEKWDDHMVAFIRKNPFSEKADVRKEGLRWLLENAVPLYLATKIEYYSVTTEEDRLEPTPNDDRDWFCWLYRQFVSWKYDKENN